MLIMNARIHTMVSEIIENGFILIKHGKIQDIGKMQQNKYYDEETIDLKSQNIYPGFIDAHTHLGVFGDGVGFESEDGNEGTDPITPNLRAIDSINPMDRCFTDALMWGITTVATGPGSANPIGGEVAVIKTFGKRIDKMIVKSPAAIKFALGENPKNVYNEKEETPITRMATAGLIREQLKKAQDYMKNCQLSKLNKDGYESPEYDAKCEALIPILNKEIPAHFHAHRADDIFTAIRIAKEFNLDFIIVHGTESHLIADELKEEKVKVLSGPILCDRSKPELVNLNPKTPAVLKDVGIDMAIITDHPVVPIQHLLICVAIAAREGIELEEAIKSITINPAKILGVSDKVGSIEKNKDADFVVFKDSPLNILEKPTMVFVNGEKVF